MRAIDYKEYILNLISVMKENKACKGIKSDEDRNAILHSIINNFPLMTPHSSKDLKEIRGKKLHVPPARGNSNTQFLR